jgi:hypothetical protein
MFSDRLSQNCPQLLSNCVSPNCQHILRDKHNQIAIAYSTIGDCQMASLFR